MARSFKKCRYAARGGRLPREGGLAGARGRTTRAHLRKRLAEVTGEVERAFYRLGAAAARADLRSPLTAIGHASSADDETKFGDVGDDGRKNAAAAANRRE